MEIPAGKYDIDSIVSQVDKGVYIEHFAWPQVDPLSGNFSNEIRNGYLIEHGELTKKIKYALLAGNLYESILKNLLIGNDCEVNSGYFMPTVGIAGTELVGQ